MCPIIEKGARSWRVVSDIKLSEFLRIGTRISWNRVVEGVANDRSVIRIHRTEIQCHCMRDALLEFLTYPWACRQPFHFSTRLRISCGAHWGGAAKRGSIVDEKLRLVPRAADTPHVYAKKADETLLGILPRMHGPKSPRNSVAHPPER